MRPLFRPEAVAAQGQQWLGRVLAVAPLRAAAARVPLVMQSEAAECGLACLAMVAGAHGLQIDLPALRRRFSVSAQGVHLGELVRMGSALDLQARVLRAEPEELSQLRLPCILHWDLNHFVVLVALRRGVALVHDPGVGLRRVKREALSRHFSGIAIELQPTAAFQPGDERQPLSLRRLVGPVSGVPRALGGILAWAALLEGLMLLSPFLLQWVVDDALPARDRGLLWRLAGGFALLVALQAAAAAARSWSVLRLSARLAQQWPMNVFAHLMRLPQAWFDKRHAGDVWSRFGAVQQIQRTLTTSFVEAVLDGALVVLTFAMMVVYSGRLSAIALAVVALYALLRRAFLRAQRAAAEEVLVAESRQASHFLESLRGAQTIRLFNARADRQARFGNLVTEAVNADVASRRLELWAAVLHRLLFGLERVAVVAVGAGLVLGGQMSVGMLFAFIAYKEQFALRVSGLVDKAVVLKMLRLQGERLADIMLSAPEEEAGAAGPGAPGRIELRGLRFRYGDGDPEVLRGVSLVIEPGESVAIVGASGCGKTTLVKLLLGLYTPTGGALIVDGHALGPQDAAAWRARVGAVMQGDGLFAGTIAENISFFEPGADLAWVEQCARRAAVHDEIAALPMGYQTLVGDLGVALSGGQQQRIVLARALYRRPQVLVLDEATSALDVDGERAVNEAVRQLALTRIIVAHRPETVASAGRVVRLADGRVAEDRRCAGSALFGGAGIEAEHRVQRAEAHGRGGQRHDADPAPDTHRAGGGQRDQHQADDDAKNAVDAADVGFHVEPPA